MLQCQDRITATYTTDLYLTLTLTLIPNPIKLWTSPTGEFAYCLVILPTGQFTYYLDVLPTGLFAKYNIGYGVARLGEKAPGMLFLSAIWCPNIWCLATFWATF